MSYLRISLNFVQINTRYLTDLVGLSLNEFRENVQGKFEYENPRPKPIYFVTLESNLNLLSLK